MKERDIFIAALQKTVPAERLAFLDEACHGDDSLRREVDALLDAIGRAGSFLEAPPPDAAPPDAAPTAAATVVEGPGTVVGPYKLKELIGEGGMGLVFVAEQHAPIRRKVAVKVIKPGMDTREVIA